MRGTFLFDLHFTNSRNAESRDLNVWSRPHRISSAAGRPIVRLWPKMRSAAGL